MDKPTRHLVIPDTQVTPDSSTDHLEWAAKYAVDKKPDVIVFLGDHWDLPSLCSYDEDKKSFEGRQYTRDIAAGIRAMRVFIDIINGERQRLIVNKKARWNPRLIFTMGNHENRVNRAVELDRKLEGLMSTDDFGLEAMGFEVYDFLQPVVVDGVVYTHYFVSGIMGRPVTSAKALLTKQHMSCVMGHVQDRDIAYAKRADGSRLTGLFAGIYYPYDQEQPYLNPQTNNSWRGIWLFNEVVDGSFDELPVSINYLENRYGR